MDGAHGLDLAPYEESFLLKSIHARRAATGLQTDAAYAGYLAEHREEADALAHSLRNRYSEFFRNPLSFALLEQLILPALIRENKHSGRNELRVWSAGCAAGQEAFSVAMLLEECTGAQTPPLSYRLFATDLPEPGPAPARTGVFTAESVDTLSLRRLNAHFTRQGNTYTIAPRLLARVDFSTYDLLDTQSHCPPASLYGEFDLILCCNLLFYYRAEVQQQILAKIRHALAPGGYVVTGEAERDVAAHQAWLRAVAPPAAVFQRKQVVK